MKLLVTGGAGFIGSNFIHYVLKKYPSSRIINFDKLTYAGNLDNLERVARDPRYRFVKGDICDYKAVDRLLRQCDIVVHFAAETHVDRSIVDAKNFVRTNVFGTYILLEAALRRKVKRFIHVSTDEVYGSIQRGFFSEGAPLNPSSPYSASKAASDLLVKSYMTTYRLPGIITRSSNNFGPYQYPEKVIPLFVTNLLENKKVPLYAQGENIRDWIFVEDNCRAIDLIVRKGKIGEIYNIAAGNYLANLDLTTRILRRMGKPLSMIRRVKDRPGHDFRYAIDCRKIKKLGFKPAHHFPQALNFTINWYRDHQVWTKKLKARY